MLTIPARSVCRPPQAVLVGALTPLRSAAKQGRRQEPCTIHLTLHPSRPRFPAAVLLRLKRSWVKQQNPQKAGQDRFLTSKVLALARPIHDWLCHQQGAARFRCLPSTIRGHLTAHGQRELGFGAASEATQAEQWPPFLAAEP